MSDNKITNPFAGRKLKSPHLEGGMSHRSNRKKPRQCECCGRMIVKPKYEDQTICAECEEEIEEERYEPQW